MSVDDATVMAYADGELDPLTAKRVERAMADDPALAASVERHRRLKEMMHRTFAPIAEEPVPDSLREMVAASNVVPLAPVRRSGPPRWMQAAAVAAALVVGVGLGHLSVPAAPVGVSNGRLVASGALGHALDTQLAADAGETRILASFKDHGGHYCRVFRGSAVDGIACHAGAGWTLDRTQTPAHVESSAYRQAASTDAPLMAAAQEMMAGAPLDRADETRARAGHW